MPLRFQPARGASVLISSTSRGPAGPGHLATPSTDNVLVRVDGTGGAVQGTGITVSDADNLVSPGTITGKTLIAAPTASSLVNGLTVAQSAAGTQNTFALNTIAVSADNVNAGSTPANNVLLISHRFGGTGLQGGRQSLAVQTVLTGASNAANALKEYAAGSFLAIAEDDDGGTAVTSYATHAGVIYGLNPYVRSLSTAPYLLGMAGLEVNVDCQSASAGEAPWYVSGINIAPVSGHLRQGVAFDAAIAIAKGAGGMGFRTGLLFCTQNGDHGVAATGTLIGVDNLSFLDHSTPVTTQFAWGVDFNTAVFTSGAWRSGTGKIVIGDTTQATTTTAAAVEIAGGLAVVKRLRVGAAIYPGPDTFEAGAGKIFTHTGGGTSGLTISGVTNGSGTYNLALVSISGANLLVNPQGTDNVVLGTSSATVTIDATAGINGPLTILSASAFALTVGRLGGTTPAFHVDANAATSITGIKVTSAAASGGVDLAAIGETNVPLRINGAGTGDIVLSTAGTGNVGVGTASPLTAAAAGKALHVYNTLNTGAVTSNASLKVESVNRNANIFLKAGATNTNSINFVNNADATVAAIIHSVANSTITFRNNTSTDRMVIAAAGGVNIANYLHVGSTSDPSNTANGDFTAVRGFFSGQITGSADIVATRASNVALIATDSAGPVTGYLQASNLGTDVQIGSSTAHIVRVVYNGTQVAAFNTTGVIITGDVYTSSTAFLHRTTGTLANGAGAGGGTLLNAPTVGNPTKWVPIDDNGTTRYIPTWT